MKTLLLAAVSAAIATVGAASVADAREGCGGGFHRGPNGYCRPNAPRVGVYYPHYGYYYNSRYWHSRYRHSNGHWRYR